DAREHAAADERRAVERQVGIDLHHGVFVQQHALGIARDADELAQRLTALRQPRRGRIRACDDASRAEVRMPIEALPPPSAESRETGHPVIAWPQRRDVAADRFDHAGALVTQDDRAVEWPAAEAVDNMKIAMADARRRRANEHFMAPGLVDVDRLDGQRRVRRAKDRGFYLHDALLTAAGSSRSTRRCRGPSRAPR